MKYALFLSLFISIIAIAQTPAERETQRKRTEAAQKILDKGKSEAKKPDKLKAENAKLRSELARIKAEVARLKSKVIALGGKLESKKPVRMKVTGVKTFDEYIQLIPPSVLPKVGVEPNAIYQKRLGVFWPKLNHHQIAMTIKVSNEVSGGEYINESGGKTTRYYIGSRIEGMEYRGRTVKGPITWVFDGRYESDLISVGKGSVLTIRGSINQTIIKVDSDSIYLQLRIGDCILVK